MLRGIFLLTIFTWSLDSYCPFKNLEISRAFVDDLLVIPTDDYLSVEKEEASEVCEIEIHSSTGDLLLVSITNFLMFSHRRPRNPNDIIVRNSDMQFIVDSKPKGYQLMKTPIWLIIPMNLNFRSILLFSNPKDCFSYDTLRCPDYSLCYNCSKYCFSTELECDGYDTCGEDESSCTFINPRTPHTSYRYGRDALSSSQIMLIGFFALNGSFIVFFLILSLCSAGLFYRCPFYAKNSKASRHTFIRYLREAIPPALAPPSQPDQGDQGKNENEITLTVPSTPPGHTRHRHSILSRINFQPAPALSEIEPEVEDREQSSQESICEPPAHQPEVFLRRQSLPFGLNAVPLSTDSMTKTDDKKTRFASRAMSFQH
ncbi:hypothetical protein GCK72_016531 [Caenorhabditis remanei]|uniref:Uncharacterized protein n=1 Tax=Caenorhabditis remanei TaxID=31234 RepID=A0A6A5G4Y7_CAERE|nr:hypothetical protein GCK72_016531 [Caenorhabditis remanei]KAF1749986.1 hypothetical protein GCK72_016531 [Caenorhabditis remanei]